MLMFTELIFEGVWSVTVCWNWPARISINVQGLCSLDCGPLKDLHSLFLFLSLFTLCLHFSWRIYVFHFTFVTTCNLFNIKRIHNSLVWYIIIIIHYVCVDSVVNHGVQSYNSIYFATLQLPRKHLFNKSSNHAYENMVRSQSECFQQLSSEIW